MKYCCVCGRQIVSYKSNDQYTVGGFPATHMCGNDLCCHICAEDLDENGLFPEERSAAYDTD
jgi:hypothetical protein